VNFAFIKQPKGGDRFGPDVQTTGDGAGRAGVARRAYALLLFSARHPKNSPWSLKRAQEPQACCPPCWSGVEPVFRPPAHCAARRTVRKTHPNFSAHPQGRTTASNPIIYTAPDFYENQPVGPLARCGFLARSTAATRPRNTNERWTFLAIYQHRPRDGAPGDIDIKSCRQPPPAWKLVSRRQVR